MDQAKAQTVRRAEVLAVSSVSKERRYDRGENRI
jgi:hypothetical protein